MIGCRGSGRHGCAWSMERSQFCQLSVHRSCRVESRWNKETGICIVPVYSRMMNTLFLYCYWEPGTWSQECTIATALFTHISVIKSVRFFDCRRSRCLSRVYTVYCILQRILLSDWFDSLQGLILAHTPSYSEYRVGHSAGVVLQHCSTNVLKGEMSGFPRMNSWLGSACTELYCTGVRQDGDSRTYVQVQLCMHTKTPYVMCITCIQGVSELWAIPRCVLSPWNPNPWHQLHFSLWYMDGENPYHIPYLVCKHIYPPIP